VQFSILQDVLDSAQRPPNLDFKGPTSKRGKGEGREIEKKKQGDRERERREDGIGGKKGEEWGRRGGRAKEEGRKGMGGPSSGFAPPEKFPTYATV